MPSKLARLQRLEELLTAPALKVGQELQRLREVPERVFNAAGLSPDPWQREVIGSEEKKIMLLCSRQCGKSTTSAALAIRTALLHPGSPILLLSPSLRQSGELFAKCKQMYRAFKKIVPVQSETAARLELKNGSRILSLPDSEATVRGFSGVSLLIIDEATRCSDDLYYSVRPMLAVSKGRLVLLSTPYGQRGFFFEEWENNREFKKVKVTAPECPRISKEFLEAERKSMSERWFRQEYLCNFESTIDAVFKAEDIHSAFNADTTPLFS